MKTRIASLCLLVVFAALPARAQTPTPGGGKATVEFLYNRLLALEARVAQLAAHDDQITEASLVGRYDFRLLGVEMGQNPYVATETDGFIMTLHANHSVTLERQDAQGRCRLALAGTWTVTCGPIEEEGSSPTWRYENGYLIVGAPDEGPGDQLEVLLGAGGRMFIGGGTSNFLPGHSWSALAIGIRLPN